MTTGASQGRSGVADDPAPISLLWPPGSARGSSDGLPLPADAAADLQLAEIGRASQAARGGRPARPPRAPGAPDADRAVHRSRGHRLPGEVVDELLHDVALRERLALVLPDLDALAEPGRPGRFRRPTMAPSSGSPASSATSSCSWTSPGSSSARWRPAPGPPRSRPCASTSWRSPARGVRGDRGRAAGPARDPGPGTERDDRHRPPRGSRAESADPRLERRADRGRADAAGAAARRARAVRGITPLRHGGRLHGAAEPPDPRPGRLLEEVPRRSVGRSASTRRDADRDADRVRPELALLMNGAARRADGAGRAADVPPTILPLDERVSVVDEGTTSAWRCGCTGRRAPAGCSADRWRDGRHGRHRHERHHVRRCGGRVWILTRPGQAGKTTYTRAVGLAHVLFVRPLCPGPARPPVIPSTPSTPISRAASRYIPGMGRAWTRRPSAWPESSSGRRPRSLVLLNETLAGPPRAGRSARARCRPGPRLLGARAVYVTPARPGSVRRRAERDDAGASLVGSLVADADDEAESSPVTPTAHVRIHPGTPRGRELRVDIARRYGIGYPQLAALLRGAASRRRTEPDTDPASAWQDPRRELPHPEPIRFAQGRLREGDPGAKGRLATFTLRHRRARGTN